MSNSHANFSQNTICLGKIQKRAVNVTKSWQKGAIDKISLILIYLRKSKKKIILCKCQQEEEKVQGKYLEILDKKGKKGNYDLEPNAEQPWRNNVQIYNAENGPFYPYNLYKCATWVLCLLENRWWQELNSPETKLNLLAFADNLANRSFHSAGNKAELRLWALVLFPLTWEVNLTPAYARTCLALMWCALVWEERSNLGQGFLERGDWN